MQIKNATIDRKSIITKLSAVVALGEAAIEASKAGIQEKIQAGLDAQISTLDGIHFEAASRGIELVDTAPLKRAVTAAKNTIDTLNNIANDELEVVGTEDVAGLSRQVKAIEDLITVTDGAATVKVKPTKYDLLVTLVKSSK